MKVRPQTTLLLHPCGEKVNQSQSERIYLQEADTPGQGAAYLSVCMRSLHGYCRASASHLGCAPGGCDREQLTGP